MGMLYEWGRKDPFTFSTSSEMWGSNWQQRGKYPVKIYTIDGVLIYQTDNGGDNKDKQPVGGVMSSSILATSMMEAIKNPIIYFSSPVISQAGHTESLWNYYWTSYSRGVDGKFELSDGYPKWHNNYLDGYTSQLLKPIYDPCPYGYRIPSNGTYNQFTSNPGWVGNSILGGVQYVISPTITWMPSMGMRFEGFGLSYYSGQWSSYRMSTIGNNAKGYAFENCYFMEMRYNRHDMPHSRGTSVRCIEEVISKRVIFKLYTLTSRKVRSQNLT